jgi:4-hydroxy-2-oxoheptanedioate aldolase
MRNKVKETIMGGGKAFGTFFELGSMNVMECLGRTGLDFVIIDNEHGPFEAESSADFIRAAELGGLTPFARVREISRPAVLKLLDVGAKGLIVPCVETVEQVEKLVEYAKYAPIGKRGFCPTRKDAWGFDYPATEGMKENMRICNEEALLIPQCETVGCLEHIEEITAMEGVDGIFVGPFDLSISMGIPGEFQNPEFLAAVARILKACQDNHKISIIFTGNIDAVNAYYEQGFDAVTYSLDAAVLVDAFREIAGKTKR